MAGVSWRSAQQGAAPEAESGPTLLQHLEMLGWVDCTAMAVIAAFFVIGLFKGLFWQVSRIGILVASYIVAGRFGGDLGRWLARDVHAAEIGAAAATPAPATPPDALFYVSYLILFVGVLIVLGLIAMQVQKLVKKTGLGFFDRIGGGLFGVATGACTVLFLLFVVNMFFRDTVLGRQAEASHSQRLSRRAIDWLGPRVPDEVRNALELAPLSSQGAPDAPPDAPPDNNR